MKKAQISLQFNWIFVFIVGAVILLFFLVIVRSQTKDADYELAGEIIKNLDTVVKSSEQTAGTLKMIKIPDVTIEFVCEPDTKVSFYDIGNGVSKDTPHDIIFSQKELSGTELISWTQSWNVPFRIGFFQYLTTRRAQYIIVNDILDESQGGLSEKLFKMLPKNITKILIEQGEDVEDKGYDYYKIIQFKGNEHGGDVKAPDDKVQIIMIETNDLNAHGTVNFTRENKVLKFLKKESLFGAIFAEDVDFYNCTMAKAFERLKTLMTLSHDRTSQLRVEVSDTKCSTLYEWSLDDIDNILSTIDASGLNGADSIYEASKQLARGNQNLIRGRNCPLIY
ncbi:MAG: hypothetical protein ISS25_01010 [Nanoarchaeota archaeon]|nr:hypothetical protein [DPANN group archaeon]MBL7116393.1 hypothetical protein [Nanoarchaeota archaeon]